MSYWIQRNRLQEVTTVFDEQIHRRETGEPKPETLIIRGAGVKQVLKALEE